MSCGFYFRAERDEINLDYSTCQSLKNVWFLLIGQLYISVFHRNANKIEIFSNGSEQLEYDEIQWRIFLTTFGLTINAVIIFLNTNSIMFRSFVSQKWIHLKEQCSFMFNKWTMKQVFYSLLVFSPFIALRCIRTYLYNKLCIFDVFIGNWNY